MATEWEYETDHVKAVPDAKALNVRGAKGWELINVVANWNGQTGAYLGVYSYTVLWKRPTPQSTEGQAR